LTAPAQILPLGGRPQTVRKPPLPALSGLRAILAVNVMFFHFTPPHPAFLTPVIDNAYVFVGFFFLISGFVLAYNYAERPQLNLRSFYLARISRVYPVYLLVLLLSIPFLMQEWHAHSHQDFYIGLALTPFALQGWFPSLATFWNTVGWTVPAEFTLYLLFPFLLRILARQAHRLATPGRIIAAILTLWVIGILPHIAYFLLNPDHLNAPATRYTYAYWLRFLKYSPAVYICTFSAGILLARLQAVSSPSVTTRTGFALAALTALTVFFSVGVQRIPYILVHGSLLLPLFSLLLLGLSGQNLVSNLFSWRPLVLFGEITFVLYLVHFNTFLLLHMYNVPQRLHVASLDPWISFLAIIALAFGVHRFFEVPARNLVLRLFSPAS